MIGESLFIQLKGAVIKKDGTMVRDLVADLAGVECGGLWVRNAIIEGVLEEMVWKAELELGGPDAVGSLEIGFFIPFSEIVHVKARRLRER